MDVSRIGGLSPYTVNSLRANKQDNRAKDLVQNQVISRDNKEKIEAGCLVEVTSEPVDEKKRAYESYCTEYYVGMTNAKNGLYSGVTLEDMYKYTLGEYDKIDKGTDDEETKSMRRSALEMVLKNSTTSYSKFQMALSYKLAPPESFEKDKAKQAEMRTFQYNQATAITNSVKKLTLNFLDFIKNNVGNDFESMLNYVNKNSTNNRDVNNLSTAEFSGFFDYAKNASYMHAQSNADADFYKGYFDTVSNGSVNKALDNRWERTAFDNEIYQKYAKNAFYN